MSVKGHIDRSRMPPFDSPHRAWRSSFLLVASKEEQEHSRRMGGGSGTEENVVVSVLKMARRGQIKEMAFIPYDNGSDMLEVILGFRFYHSVGM